MPPPKFIFVRHGEAQHNVAFREVGNTAFSDPANKDAPLTDQGHQQARAAGVALADLPILDIWCSPLTRCIQTAEEIFEEVDAEELHLHDSLVERLGGGHVCNERKLRHELKALYPIWKIQYLSSLPAVWAEREPLLCVRQRMLSFMMWLTHVYQNAPDGAHIIIVSHCDSIYALTGRSLKNAEHVILSLEDVLLLSKEGPRPKLVTATPSSDEV